MVEQRQEVDYPDTVYTLAHKHLAAEFPEMTKHTAHSLKQILSAACTVLSTQSEFSSSWECPVNQQLPTRASSSLKGSV